MYGMTIKDLLDQGIDFQSEVRLCYWDDEKEVRVCCKDIPELYDILENEPIRYIYTDKESSERGDVVIYVEVEKPEDLIENDFAICRRCGKVTIYTDEGGRCEDVYGWLCHECINVLKEEGEELHFQDEEIEEEVHYVQ